jgi:hypothetical protein
MNWGNYRPSGWVALQTASQLSRRDARRWFDNLMAESTARLAELERLTAQSGSVIDMTDAGIQELNEWFVCNVEPDPKSPGNMKPIWYSVCQDIMLYIGQTIVLRDAKLQWELCVAGRRNVAYQQPVIVGFEHRPYLEVGRRVWTYGNRIVENKGSKPTYGIMRVRGKDIDIDAVRSSIGSPDLDLHVFARILDLAARDEWR